MKNIAEIGKKIYRINYHKELKRYIYFRLRALFNGGRMDRIDSYYHKDPVREEIARLYPFVYEQPQRAFFYNKSGFDERIRLMEEHMDALIDFFDPQVIYDIYGGEEKNLWQADFEGEPLRLALSFNPGQRKEGVLSVVLRLGERYLYQIIFWLGNTPAIDRGLESSGRNFYIGAMQGPNGEEPKEIIKRLTKFCHGCRTKNLILYAAQAVARSIGAEYIYAVTNSGYYAMNHLRLDRKLKTSFDGFWQEAGGKPAADSRFYELPLREHRKSPEEIPTRKRAVYRRRFALLDEIDESIESRMKELKKK